MSNLTIRKKSLNTWLHTDSIFGDFIISKFYFNSYDGQFRIVEEGNSRLVAYEIANITLYDDTDGGTPETFSTITELSLRLEALQYPAFDRTGTTIFPSMEQITNVNVTDIEDNQVLAWDVATSKWVNITTGGLSTPTLQEVTDEGAETTIKTIFRTSETEWIEIGGDSNGISIYNDVFGSLPTPKRIIDIAYNGLGINTYDTDTGEPTGFAGIGDKTLVAGEVVGGVQGKYTLIYPDRIIKGINGTTSFDSFLPSEDNDLNGSKVISANTTASNAINYLAVANLTMTDITPPSEGAFYYVTVINGTATIGGVGYTVGQKVFRHYHSGSWRTFVYLDKSIIDTLLANKIDYLIKDFTFSPVTGVTSETLVESYEITAGKIGLNDFLNGFIYTTRTGSSNAYTVTLKANTVNNSSTATTIASVATAGNFVPFFPMKFELTVKSGVIVGAIVDQVSGTNYKGQSSAINVSFDNSSNSVYLFLFVTPTNTSSVVQVQSFKLTK